MEACRGKDFIKCLVIASSDKAYGSQKHLPYTEDMPLQGIHPYDVSKSCADLLSIAYYNTYKVPVCVTRCGNIYGPGDLNFSRIVPDAIQSILKGRQFIIRSDGRYTRDYVYVKDIVKGYILLPEKMEKLKLYGQVFNFSNEKPITVLNLLKKIVKVFDSIGKHKTSFLTTENRVEVIAKRFSCKKILPPKVLNEARYEIKHQYLSAEKARSILDWKPRYSLDEGLKRTIEWYTQSYNRRH